MAIFERWCETTKEESENKCLLLLTEEDDGREEIRDELCEIVRSHYEDLACIADDIADLGYETAAAILKERLPRTRRARSGDLGEILASELTEEELEFEIPVRRMRYKDGREVPLRGDDFIGLRLDDDNRLVLLKGEAKSRAVLSKTTITQARTALDGDNGRCTPCSLLFLADRLLEGSEDEMLLGRSIRRDVGTKSIPSRRIYHVLFTLSGNAPTASLVKDLEGANAAHNQTVINLRIEGHQEFIADIYEGAGDLGDD